MIRNVWGTLLYVRTPGAEKIVQRHLETLASNPRLQHYARIPHRICSCLDWFGVQYDRRKAEEILSAYYLFIGIVDHAIDTVSTDIGFQVLNQLRAPYSFSIDLFQSSPGFITENLKAQIAPEILPVVLSRLDELHNAVCREQSCSNVNDYIRERELIGRLTAEVSYLLLTPYLDREFPQIRNFVMRVGEVGCLVDSLIDLQIDSQSGLILFKPTLKTYIKLLLPTIRKGTLLFFRYPRLIPLFMAAVADNIKDISR